MENKKKQRKANNGKSFVVGLLVLVIAGFVFPGFGLILLMSTICTYGIGLVVWIPVAILIGKIITSFGKEEAEDDSGTPPEEDALHKYVREVSGPPYNCSEDQVRSSLRLAGWDNTSIEKVIYDVFKSKA